MDDLQLLRRFRSDVPPPDGPARSRALAAMMGSDRVVVRVGGPRRSARRWRVAAAMAAAVAIAVAVPVILPGGRRGAAPAAAAALLHAAEVAASQDAVPAPGAGQFVYTKTKNAYANVYAMEGDRSFAVLMPEVREAWIGPDGSGRLLERNGTPTFLSDRDRAVWEGTGQPDLGTNRISDESFPANDPQSLYYLDLSGLPTDAAGLRAKIEAREIVGGPPGDAETFTIIGDMLRETYASPELRAALYRVAAGLDGVELVGETEDPVGRAGIAVAYTHHGQRHELIFDPRTSALLGERYVVTDPSKGGFDVPARTVVGWAAYLSSGIVDSTSDRP
jgi:hypothetical protein